MLHTTNESLIEKLPLKNENSGIMITSDARIDNRDELTSKLNIENNRNVPDSIFILKAYQKWGEKCPAKLLGDFAFAIWDTKKKKLFCARDHIGVKPFYYYISDNAIFFASEIKALLTNPEIEYTINKTKVANFLLDKYQNREITFFEDILRLPAANKLIVNADSFKIEKYWELDYEKRIILKSEVDYSDSFLEIFNNAVKCRLRSAFPIGSMLSGGLDSSSIVCTAREILVKNGGYPLKTFSLIFEDTPLADEQYYINHVINKGFLDPYYINADDYSPVSKLDPVLWRNDEPIRAFNLYYDNLLSKLASKKDIRIILDGLGGDSTISHGNGLLIDYIKNNQWKKFFREAKGTSDRLNHSMIKIIIGELLEIYPDRLSKFLLKNKYNNGEKILNKKFTLEIDLGNDFLKNELPEKSREHHYNIINSGLIQHVLEETDKISACYNIEPRYPFFDVRLMEFCLAIPSDEKRKYGWDRFILRQSMNNTLPKEIQWRKTKKTGLKSNIHNFINIDKEFIDYIIFNNNENIENYVDMKFIQNIYQKFKDKEDAQDFFELWKVVSLGLWMNQTT